ncbi:MAG: type II toxin-antitoxin system RelE/ParE family toxin [Variibacter sp.]
MPASKREFVWSLPAERDLEEVWDYLAFEASIGVAQARMDAIERHAGTLLQHPFIGRPRDDLRPGVRGILITPHVLFYRVHADVIEILRVIHSSRDVETEFARKPLE